MRLPTVRITINPGEYSLVKPGLDLLAKRLATARLGRFPHCHPFHRIDLLASNVYRNRMYNELFDKGVIEIRRKLWNLISSRRIYVNFVDLCILSFALRLLHDADPASSKAKSHDIVQALVQKLEKFRKRAKRSAIAALGKQSYDDAAMRWRRFSDWARFYLLYSRIPRRGTPIIKSLWQQKRKQMADLIQITVKERFDCVLTEAQLNRMRDLVIPSLRRGRQELTLNTVLSGSDAAKDFLVGFITKRLPLKKGPNAPRTFWEHKWERTEVLAAAVRRPMTSSQHPSVLASVEQSSDNPIIIPDICNIQSSSNAATPQPFNDLRNQEIIDAVECWFINNVEPAFRQEVFDQARELVLSHPQQYRRSLVSRSLRDLIEVARPPMDAIVLSDDYTRAHVEWLLGWMLALCPYPKFVFQSIGAGYAAAIKSAA